jgi:hypothetical protein
MRAEAVLGAAHEIAERAVSRDRDELLRTLMNNGVLAAVDTITSQDEQLDFRVTRGVLVSWLRRSFNLEPTYEPGQILELPATALARMTVQGAVSADAFVTVRVIESGWKANGKVVVPPGVIVIQPQ